jgi:hypothetical protein
MQTHGSSCLIHTMWDLNEKLQLFFSCIAQTVELFLRCLTLELGRGGWEVGNLILSWCLRRRKEICSRGIPPILPILPHQIIMVGIHWSSRVCFETRKRVVGFNFIPSMNRSKERPRTTNRHRLLPSTFLPFPPLFPQAEPPTSNRQLVSSCSFEKLLIDAQVGRENRASV